MQALEATDNTKSLKLPQCLPGYTVSVCHFLIFFPVQTFICIRRPSVMSPSCFIITFFHQGFTVSPLASQPFIHCMHSCRGEKGQPSIAAAQWSSRSLMLRSASQLHVALRKLQHELPDRESQHALVKARGGQAAAFLGKDPAHHACSHHKEAHTPGEPPAHCWLCLFCFTAFTATLH